MYFNSLEQVKRFIQEVENCQGEVFMISVYGDKFNLKSKLSQYVAIGTMLSDRADDLELFCENKADQWRMLRFLSENMDIVA